jgi:rSAM/selenodomain-associated transferase 1
MKLLHHVLDPNRPFIADNLCALAVMTKAPRAGQVKTRLVPPLTHEEAAQLNICFLRDTASAIAKACGATALGVGVYTPIGSEAVYIDILPQSFELLPQRGDGFGERLLYAVTDLFRCGFSSVCLIDSDSPTVSADAYAQAVKLLSAPNDRVVLGPSDDGGYYLIGMKRDHPQLLERIDWSTEGVLNQTKQRARELNLEVSLLPTGYDVDDGATLHRLRNELLSEKASDHVAPQTRKFLVQLTAQRKL